MFICPFCFGSRRSDAGPEKKTRSKWTTNELHWPEPLQQVPDVGLTQVVLRSRWQGIPFRGWISGKGSPEVVHGRCAWQWWLHVSCCHNPLQRGLAVSPQNCRAEEVVLQPAETGVVQETMLGHMPFLSCWPRRHTFRGHLSQCWVAVHHGNWASLGYKTCAVKLLYPWPRISWNIFCCRSLAHMAFGRRAKFCVQRGEASFGWGAWEKCWCSPWPPLFWVQVFLSKHWLPVLCFQV